MENMKHHNSYLTGSVLLLADVVQKFKSNCMKYYGLNPVHY